MSEPAPSRDRSFDAFRGVGILLVVAAHAGVAGWDFPESGPGCWNFYYSVFVRQVILSSVPIFLFVSGYWLAGSRIASLSDYAGFLKKRLSRVLVPYLLWSSLLYAFFAFRGQPYSFADFLSRLLTGRVEGPYFFIVMLMQFYLLTPVFLRLAATRRGLCAVVLSHVLVVAFLYALRFGYDKDIQFAYIKVPFASWLSFFYLGVLHRLRPGMFERMKASWLGALVIVSLLLSLVEGLFLIRFDYFELGISDIKYSSLLYSASVVTLFAAIRNKVHWPRFLAFLGDYSFGIFLIHGVILRFVLKAAAICVPFLYGVQPLYQALTGIATVLLCCGVIAVVRKCLGLTMARSVLGF